jgi:hypothetical protein
MPLYRISDNEQARGDVDLMVANPFIFHGIIACDCKKKM